MCLWDEAIAEYYEHVIQAASKHYVFPFDTTIPIKNFTLKQRNFLLYGITFPEFVETHKNIKPPKKVSQGKFEGIVPYLLSRYKSSPHNLPQPNKKYFLYTSCHKCHNTGLRKLGREVTISEKTITDVSRLSLSELLEWVRTLDVFVSADELSILASFSCALEERISNLIEVGLDYLNLDRTLPSLSAGEAQRVRLACILGSGLTGVLYVLDEPTAGLHPNDTAKLLRTLRKIQEAGNTVLLIEHDLDVIREVDHIIDLGPCGGSNGGKIVAYGSPIEVMLQQANT